MTIQQPVFRTRLKPALETHEIATRVTPVIGPESEDRWQDIRSRRSRIFRYLRYLGVLTFGLSLVWVPILVFLETAPRKYTSHLSLILPGAGASASVNLNNIGQASSNANSAFSNGSISPTETYKRLLGADRIRRAAETTLDLPEGSLPEPRIKLVDQTSLIHVELTGPDPETARAGAAALLTAFFTEIDALRQNEIATRQDSGEEAISDYLSSVRATRGSVSILRNQSGLMSADQFSARVAAKDQLAADLRGLETRLDGQSAQVAALETALALPADQAAVTLKLYADAEYRALLEDQALVATKLSLARAQFGARHPARQSAQATFDTARQVVLSRAHEVTGLPKARLGGLDRAPDGARAALLSELVRESTRLDGLKREHETLSRQVQKEEDTLLSLEKTASELEDRQRDFEVAEAVLASAIARSRATLTDIYASYPLVQVLEDPTLPNHPSSPRRKLALAGGVAGSLMLVAALMLGWSRRPLIAKLTGARHGA